MLKSVNLVALQPFGFEGRAYVQDDVFEVRPIAAAALTRARWARFAMAHEAPVTNTVVMEPGPPAAQMSTAPAKSKPKRPRKPRKKPYQRRDIVSANVQS